MEVLIPLVLLIGGAVTGLYASTVGGGGLVTLPLLIFSGLPIHMAIGTNRFAIVLLELSSSLKFLKEKKLDLKLGVIMGLAAAGGAVIGSSIVLRIPENVLSLVVAILLLAVFVIVYNKDKLGITEKQVNKKNLWLMAVFSFFLGIYGGFLGPGFGTFIMFLFLLGGLSFIKSAAVSRAVGVFMSVAAMIVFAYHGMINYTYAVSLGIGLALGGWIGAGFAVKKGDQYVKALFIVIIILTAVKLLLEFLGISLI